MPLQRDKRTFHARLIGAYKPEGYEWVDELNQVLANNVDFACDTFGSNTKVFRSPSLRHLYAFPRLHQMV